MCCTKGEVAEERTVGTNTLEVCNDAQCLINEIFRQVVTIFRTSWWRNRVIVRDKFWMELICFTIEESVEAIESARNRPLIEWAGSRTLFHRRQVPLTESERSVSLVAQHFGNCCCVI